MFHHSSSFLLGTQMRFLPVSGAQNPPWQRSGCLHYRIPAQPLSRKLAGEGGCRRDSPGQGTAPSPVCADKNSLPGTFPAGCLCHIRCGLCHGADCSPESTGCDSQLTFSINPLFCGPSSGTSRGTVFFMGRVSAILEPENGAGTMMRNMRLGLAILAAVLICAGCAGEPAGDFPPPPDSWTALCRSWADRIS